MLKITNGTVEFPIHLTLDFPTSQRSCGQVFTFHQKWCYNHLRQHVISIPKNIQCIADEAFYEKPTKIVNATKVKSLKKSLDINRRSLTQKNSYIPP